MATRKMQRHAVEFLLRYPSEWHGYQNDRDTVEVVCALVNLGIAITNTFRQFRLCSESKARAFLSN